MEYPKPKRLVKEHGVIFQHTGLLSIGYNSLHRLDGPLSEYDGWGKFGWYGRIDGKSRGCYIWNNQYIQRSEQEYKLYIETLKLDSINQFIDFVARCGIILL